MRPRAARGLVLLRVDLEGQRLECLAPLGHGRTAARPLDEPERAFQRRLSGAACRWRRRARPTAPDELDRRQREQRDREREESEPSGVGEIGSPARERAPRSRRTGTPDDDARVVPVDARDASGAAARTPARASCPRARPRGTIAAGTRTRFCRASDRREERKVRGLGDRDVAREGSGDAVFSEASDPCRVAKMRELPDLFFRDDRLSDRLVRLEVGLHTHFIGFDLLAVDDDLDGPRAARRTGGRPASGRRARRRSCPREQRLRVVPPASREHDSEYADEGDAACHALPRVNMR